MKFASGASPTNTEAKTTEKKHPAKRKAKPCLRKQQQMKREALFAISLRNAIS